MGPSKNNATINQLEVQIYRIAIGGRQKIQFWFRIEFVPFDVDAKFWYHLSRVFSLEIPKGNRWKARETPERARQS